jgi:hypothetical protein
MIESGRESRTTATCVMPLTELRAQFDRWDRGEIDSFELNDLVHKYHDGTSREIWKRFATSHLAPAVASAVRRVCRGVCHLARLATSFSLAMSATFRVKAISSAEVMVPE